jgi:DNA-binding response OmpR family regulator
MAVRFNFDHVSGERERPRILVVEPDRRYCGVLARRLGEFGYRVATADCAQSAMAELHRMPVNLVLSEARLRVTSGVELVRMIREDATHRELPILLVVGRSDSGAAVRAFEAGADGVVRKPCHFEVLAACIARQLERADAMKRLADDNAALDARVIERAIQLGELRQRLAQLEAAGKAA